MRYLNTFGIDVLTFPGHPTHVLQPVDVGVTPVRRDEYVGQLPIASAIIQQRFARLWDKVPHTMIVCH